MILQTDWLADHARWRRWQGAVRFMVAAQLADLLTMLLVIALVGIEAEANPFLRLVFAVSGPAGLIAVKLAFTWVIYRMAQLAYRGDLLLLLAGGLLTLLLGAFVNGYVLWMVLLH